MTRVAVFGASFATAVEVLGLELADERPDVVLLDLGDPHAIALAAAMPAEVPRVIVGSEEQGTLIAALGCTVAFARSPEPASIGPLIAAAVPARSRDRTRLILVTGVRGGIGRTLLVANLATRLSARATVLAIDVTGTGAVGWWLGLAPGPWSDLEGLVDELTSEHLGIVAAERERMRIIGGISAMPSAALLVATARAAMDVADVVIVDAPPLFDERTRALLDLADRVLLVVNDDPVSLAAIDGVVDDDRTWIIASRCRVDRLGGHDVVRALPDDPAALRGAMKGPSPVAGELGRAYDALGELLGIDIA